MEALVQMRLKKIFLFISLFFILFAFTCALNILASRYYRLLEKERKLYLGLRAIDSISAEKYLNLPSPTERKYFYEEYWQGREEEREEFEKRCEYAYKEFARYAPLSDERVLLYVKHGNPTRRYIITPEKKVGMASREYVRPAEIWTYKEEGIEFDLIRLGRAYQVIARTQFGDKVEIPFLKDDTGSVVIEQTLSPEKLKFTVSVGRFRQKKNLVRLEIYSLVTIETQDDCQIYRTIRIYDEKDNLVEERSNLLKPAGVKELNYYDESNFWLTPGEYFVKMEYINLKNSKSGKTEFAVNLLDYKDDAKKISDLVFARLIDGSLTDEKFYKPVGRVIPMVISKQPVAMPFYLYHEVYNLTTKDGMHFLKIDYEIYNKDQLHKEIVDILSQSESSEGDVAYIASKYHPMDLPPGRYIVVARNKDLFSGEEFSTVGEFELEKVK